MKTALRTIGARSHTGVVRQIRRIEDLLPGDHLCCIYSDDEERRRLLARFLHDGLERGEKVVYVADETTVDEVFSFIDSARFSITTLRERGQLVILHSQEAYVRAGAFDPAEMISLLRVLCEAARKEGYTALRVTGEASWVFRGLPGSHRLMEYEALVNDFFPGSNCIALCQYDRRRFPPELLQQVLATHPFIVFGGEVRQNQFSLSPNDFLTGNIAERQLERQLESIQVSSEIERDLHRFFAASPNLVCIAGVDGYFRMVNPAWTKMLGYSESELLTKPFLDFIHPDDHRRNDLEVNALMQGRITTNFENRYLAKDGTVHHILWTATPYVEEQIMFCIGNDITRLREQESLMRTTLEHDRRLREALDSVPACVFMKDAQFRYSYANQTVQHVLGRRYEEIIGKEDAELFPDDVAKRLRATDQRVLEGAQALDEVMVQTGSGARVFKVFKAPLRANDTQSKCVGILGISTDITDARHQEVCLKNSLAQAQQREQEMELLLHAARQILNTEEFKDIVTQTYPLMKSLLGFQCGFVNIRLVPDTAETAILTDVGTNAVCSLPIPETFALSEFRRYLYSRAAPLRITDFSKTPVPCHFPEGHVPLYNGLCIPLILDEQVQGLMVFGNKPGGFTERDEQFGLAFGNLLTIGLHNERQRRALHRLSTAVEQSTDAVLITDVSGVIQYLNPSYLALSGYSSDECLGRNPRMFKSGVQETNFYQELWKTISDGRVFRGTFVNRRKDGGTWVMETTVNPVRDSNGKTTHFIAIGRDVTRERQLERQYQQAQKLEAIGRLAGGIAHDFNNILQVMSCYIFSIQEGLPEGRFPRDEVDEIGQAVDKAAHLVKQLLTFSKQEPPRFGSVNVDEVITNLLKLVRRVLGEDIELRFSPSGDLPPIRADRTHLEQILMNLVVNARDAMPEGGKIAIETRRVRFDTALHDGSRHLSAGNGVQILVRDSGCGISDANLEHIFEPFFTTKEVGKGTGLGLATVFGIVKQHQGLIDVKSSLGVGTEFTLTFPALAPESTNEQHHEPESVVVGGHETILLAEDDQMVRNIAAQILRTAGYQLILACDGEQALQLAHDNEGRIDVFVLDVIMPKKRGREIFLDLRRLCPRSSFLFVSGYGPELPDLQQVDGSFEFLAKPFSPGVLLRKIRELLKRKEVGKP